MFSELVGAQSGHLQFQFLGTVLSCVMLRMCATKNSVEGAAE